MKKKAVLLFLLFLLVTCVFASSDLKTEKTQKPKFDLYASICPYGFQFIDYYRDYNDINSKYGFGAEIGTVCPLSDYFSLGLGLSYNRYSYTDFHKYNDIKIKLSSKYTLLNINRKFTTSLIFDAGADFVFRDDSDFGAYPLLGLGLEVKYRVSKATSLFLDGQCQMTIQKGSVVYHIVPHLGFVIHLGNERD